MKWLHKALLAWNELNSDDFDRQAHAASLLRQAHLDSQGTAPAEWLDAADALVLGQREDGYAAVVAGFDRLVAERIGPFECAASGWSDEQRRTAMHRTALQLTKALRDRLRAIYENDDATAILMVEATATMLAAVTTEALAHVPPEQAQEYLTKSLVKLISAFKAARKHGGEFDIQFRIIREGEDQ